MKIITEIARKKVLHIGLDTGGVKTYMVQVFENCDPAKYKFIVIAPENELFESYCKQKFIKYYRANLLRGSGALATLAAIATIIKVILNEKPDVIQAHSAKAGFLGRLAAKLTGSKNVIYTPHAFSYLSFTGIKRMIFYALEILARGWASVLLAISYSEADKAVYEVGYRKEKVKTVLNAISIPDSFENKLPGSLINIRMVGRLTIQKNPMLFLEIANEICSKYDNARFSILGAGIHDDLAEEINDYIESNALKEKVKIEGWADSVKSRQFIQEADIFLMTSTFEGMPYSLLEAMVLGKPCIVSDVDGNKDVIRNGENGFTCLSKQDFCNKIELLINDKQLKDNIGRAAFSYVYLHHNIVNNIVQLENIYATLCQPALHDQTDVMADNIVPLRTGN